MESMGGVFATVVGYSESVCTMPRKLLVVEGQSSFIAGIYCR